MAFNTLMKPRLYNELYAIFMFSRNRRNISHGEHRWASCNVDNQSVIQITAI